MIVSAAKQATPDLADHFDRQFVAYSPIQTDGVVDASCLEKTVGRTAKHALGDIGLQRI
jgi:hypothetical protein